MDLPATLGALRLTARIVWTCLHDTERTLEGNRQSHYQSGVEFTAPNPAQQAGLAAALATVQAAMDQPDEGASR